jgi:uncharacterized membrane protein YGL010W
MTTSPELLDQPDPRRPIDRWLDSYSGDHQNPTNQLVHLVCVPAIVWSVTAALWVIPSPAELRQEGLWFKLAAFAAWLFYFRLSRPLAVGMLLLFVAAGFLNNWIESVLGTQGLLVLAIGVFVAAWIGQFWGHKVEGRRPSFFTDLQYLLIGPLWTLDKLYRRLGWSH